MGFTTTSHRQSVIPQFLSPLLGHDVHFLTWPSAKGLSSPLPPAYFWSSVKQSRSTCPSPTKKTYGKFPTKLRDRAIIHAGL